ncbi:MAG: helix-turn-helix domain-containing protein [Vallitalea sp.]|jgi:transcriptional regulator with XRE-family HTH domain|nr:helix-turn-helix domain-containing protein [Vallitalea sp.]
MNIDFGNRLKKELKKNNITQKEATELLNLSKNAIGNYVKGRVPTAEILYKLSNLFNVSMEYLLTGEENTSTYKENSQYNKLVYTDEIIYLLEDYFLINENNESLKNKLIEHIQDTYQLQVKQDFNQLSLFNLNIENISKEKNIGKSLFEIFEDIKTKLPKEYDRKLIDRVENKIIPLFKDINIESNISNDNINEDETKMLELYRKLTPRNQIKLEAVAEEYIREKGYNEKATSSISSTGDNSSNRGGIA